MSHEKIPGRGETKEGAGQDAVAKTEKNHLGYDQVRAALHKTADTSFEEPENLSEKIPGQIGESLAKVDANLANTKPYMRPDQFGALTLSDTAGAAEAYKRLNKAKDELSALQDSVQYLNEYDQRTLSRALENEDADALLQIVKKVEAAKATEKYALSQYENTAASGSDFVDQAHELRYSLSAVINTYKPVLEQLQASFAKNINERMDAVEKAKAGMFGSKEKSVKKFEEFAKDFDVLEGDLTGKEAEITSEISSKITVMEGYANDKLRKQVDGDTRLVSPAARDQAYRATQKRYFSIPAGKQEDQLRTMSVLTEETRKKSGLDEATLRVRNIASSLGIEG